MLVTFTTVGYGDVSPEGHAGKVVGSVAILAGVVLLAMPLAIVGDNFSKAWEERSKVRLTLRVQRTCIDRNISLKGMLQLFEEADTDRSGFLDYLEFHRLLDELGLDYTASEARRLFHLLDEGQSGDITFFEFCHAVFPNLDVERLCDRGILQLEHSSATASASATSASAVSAPAAASAAACASASAALGSPKRCGKSGGEGGSPKLPPGSSRLLKSAARAIMITAGHSTRQRPSAPSSFCGSRDSLPRDSVPSVSASMDGSGMDGFIRSLHMHRREQARAQGRRTNGGAPSSILSQSAANLPAAGAVRSPLQRPTPLQRPSSDIGLERYLKPRARTGNLSPQWRSSDGGDAGAGFSSASAQREIVALMERMQRRQAALASSVERIERHLARGVGGGGGGGRGSGGAAGGSSGDEESEEGG